MLLELQHDAAQHLMRPQQVDKPVSPDSRRQILMEAKEPSNGGSEEAAEIEQLREQLREQYEANKLSEEVLRKSVKEAEARLAKAQKSFAVSSGLNYLLLLQPGAGQQGML